LEVVFFWKQREWFVQRVLIAGWVACAESGEIAVSLPELSHQIGSSAGMGLGEALVFGSFEIPCFGHGRFNKSREVFPGRRVKNG
jgi:hypothetical protein